MSFRVITAPHRVEFVEKHSRFLGIGYPCQSLESFKAFKKELETEFPDANHITFAYKIQEDGLIQQRFSDAGEPAGTAGKPILMHIEGAKLINVAVFVVRYFGGIKLGAGGLVRAYGGAAKQLILEALIIDFVPLIEFELTLGHAEQRQFEYCCKKFGAVILERIWGADLKVRVQIAENEKAAFLAALS